MENKRKKKSFWHWLPFKFSKCVTEEWVKIIFHINLFEQHVSDAVDRTEEFNPEYSFKAEISPLKQSC